MVSYENHSYTSTKIDTGPHNIYSDKTYNFILQWKIISLKCTWREATLPFELQLKSDAYKTKHIFQHLVKTWCNLIPYPLTFKATNTFMGFDLIKPVFISNNSMRILVIIMKKYIVTLYILYLDVADYPSRRKYIYIFGIIIRLYIFITINEISINNIIIWM